MGSVKSIGALDSREEATAIIKYIKTKFCRVSLSVLKVTQHNTSVAWAKVPLQNFKPTSDIDWSQSVANIDQQLYKKYDLTQEEIDFVETNVKEMG